MNDEKMTPQEASDYLGVHVSTLCVWRKSGKGPKSYQPNGSGKIYYFKSDLINWIKGEQNDDQEEGKGGSRAVSKSR